MEDRLVEAVLNAVLRMPDPLPRILLGELEQTCPELTRQVFRLQQLKVPFLRLDEARRTTTTMERQEGPRFSAVLITAETDNGQLICWPQFILDRLPHHDLKLLLLSLEEWAGVVRRRLAERPKQEAQERVDKQTKKEMEDAL